MCEEEPEPGPCQPGEYCPPCPPGVEADYCADDDELDDTDECILNPELCVDIPPTLVAEDEDETVEDETEEEGNSNPPVNFGPDGPVDEDERMKMVAMTVIASPKVKMKEMKEAVMATAIMVQ